MWEARDLASVKMSFCLNIRFMVMAVRGKDRAGQEAPQRKHRQSRGLRAAWAGSMCGIQEQRRHVQKAGLRSWAFFHLAPTKPVSPPGLALSPICNPGKVLSCSVFPQLQLGISCIRTTWKASQVCRFLGLSLDLGKGGNLKSLSIACTFRVTLTHTLLQNL